MRVLLRRGFSLAEPTQLPTTLHALDLVARVGENGAALLSPLFAGRGWVRGLGD